MNAQHEPEEQRPRAWLKKCPWCRDGCGFCRYEGYLIMRETDHAHRESHDHDIPDDIDR